MATPQDNLTDNVRPIPPEGIELTAADRGELEMGLTALRKASHVIAWTFGFTVAVNG